MSEKPKFDITESPLNDISVIALMGYLDVHTASRLEDKLAELIKRGRKKIVVDFEGLDYISSAGLGVFMAFIEELRNTGGDIKMVKMKDKVYSVFDLLGFPVLFDIDQKLESAIDKFEKNQIKNNNE